MHAAKHVILCVTDDRGRLEALRQALETHGYLFEGAASPEEALRARHTAKPDLLIVDLPMGAADAVTRLVSNLKAARCRAPIYLLSTVDDVLRIDIDALQPWLAGVFQKPLSLKNLLATLDTHLKADGLSAADTARR